jgi:hypothetical protein
MLQFLRNILNPHTGKLDVIGFDSSVMAAIAANIVHIGPTAPENPSFGMIWIDTTMTGA